MSSTPHARERVGAAVRAERKSRSLSIEAAAKAGGIGHMTWRKIEQGGSVHDQSYYAIDRAFGWTSGHTRTAVEDDTDLVQASNAADTDATVGFRPDRRSAAERIYVDHATGDTKLDTSFRFHDEFYMTLDRLSRLNVSELRAVHHACERHITEIPEDIEKLRRMIPDEPLIRAEDMQQATAMWQDKELTHLNDAYRRHLEAYTRAAELRVEIYEMTNLPIGDLKINEMREKIAQACEKLQSTCDEVATFLWSKFRAEHNRIETE